jgi:hypothetical protein
MRRIVALVAGGLLVGVAAPAAAQARSPGPVRPTVADAAAFMVRAESTLYDLSVTGSRAGWVSNVM